MVATHGEWFTGLDESMRAEARECLLTGTYSRRLLVSLRQAGLATRPGAGLDDPRLAQPGDPLGARLQTFLRERFFSRPKPAADGLEHWAPRWVDQVPVPPVSRARATLRQHTVELPRPARETCQ
ncbi:hypothetical protein [Kineococcus rubinsiae]|uniref:hypothetical protein n=1 Tax=Kineococcus rubinsiae TaxID=2609562 RepID=UPI00142F6803|nr:hypothetical protein [Kineococcus rubinsiae]NIZ92972.1 hypothetical protein [Kineococcus rubinsiae]